MDGIYYAKYLKYKKKYLQMNDDNIKQRLGGPKYIKHRVPFKSNKPSNENVERVTGLLMDEVPIMREGGSKFVTDIKTNDVVVSGGDINDEWVDFLTVEGGRLVATGLLADIANTKNRDGNTLLYVACLKNNLVMAKILVGVGADHTMRGDDGSTLLHGLLDKSNDAKIKELLEYIVSLNIQGKESTTGLFEDNYKGEVVLKKLCKPH